MAAATISSNRPEPRPGSRRIFPPQFKLQVLEAYRRDAQCRGNQRATARKFGIHRRQIQKWLQAEPALRAALLRRAPQPAPSPPPYVAAGSPESARLPTPPPSMPSPPMETQMPVPHMPMPVSVTVAAEPIDLSMSSRRPTPPPVQVPHSVAFPPPEPVRKPFKLFRPYLLDEPEEKKHTIASLPVPTSCGDHVSAFVPFHGASLGCTVAACVPNWCAAVPAFPTPLR